MVNLRELQEVVPSFSILGTLTIQYEKMKEDKRKYAQLSNESCFYLLVTCVSISQLIGMTVDSPRDSLQDVRFLFLLDVATKVTNNFQMGGTNNLQI